MKERLARITERVPARKDLRPGEPVIVCPWLRGLPPEAGMWLAALPIHDANAFLDEPWTLKAQDTLPDQLYFGVFMLDRLRHSEQILERLRAKGVRRLINLPTISFYDAETAATLAALDFRPDRELALLHRARQAGFGVAFCTGAPQDLSQADRDGLDFLLVHGAPGDAMWIA